MTAPARITHADFERAANAAASAIDKCGKTARIIYRLEQREIEIILGESGGDPVPDPNEWTDDDV